MLPETPQFWEEDGVMAKLLTPLSYVYQAGHKLKTALANPYTSPLPVLCIGGVVAGGSGKTPTLHALIHLIRDRGLYKNPMIVTRGYGGCLEGPIIADPAVHTWKEIGDEAMLHAGHATTIVSRDRAAGARLAEQIGADVILLDDGLQNTTLNKTLSFLVLDAKQGIGNGHILPAGPLREPLTDAAAKCAAVIMNGGQSSIDCGLPVLSTTLEVTSTHNKNASYVAFAGLGRPEKFKDTLEKNGFTIAGFYGFSDHHRYSAADLHSLIVKADGHKMITTEKDYVRLPRDIAPHVECLKIRLVFEEPDKVADLLQKARP